MKKKDNIILGAAVTAGALSLTALAWYAFKRRNANQSNFQKMQKLLEKTIYSGFDKKEFKTIFAQLTEGTNSKINELFKDPKFQGSITCSKHISGSMVGFYCLDCEGNSQIESNQMTQCADCFSKSNHEGHRYSQTTVTINQIACKCGDSNYLKPQAFCSDHRGITDEIEEEARQIIASNPEVVKTFNKLWKGIFLQLFFLIENSNKMNLGQEMGTNVVSVIDQLLYEVIDLIKLNVGFSVLFSDFLTSNIYSQTDQEAIKKHLMQQYTTNPSTTQNNKDQNIFSNQKSGSNEEETIVLNRMLYHNCRNNQDVTFLSTAQRMSIPCKCSYIENLIRFSTYLIPELILLIQDLILKLQAIPKFKKFTSSIIPKLLCYIDIYSKILLNNTRTEFHNPYLMIQRFTYPVENGCQMILDMNSFQNIFNILSKMIEGLALNTKQEQLWEIMQILYTLKSLTSQSEVNFLILLTDTSFLKNLLKTLSKIEKRGISSIFGQQNFYSQISYISTCQSYLQFIVYQFIRDMTLLANEEEADSIFTKLVSYISSSNLPSAKKLKDMPRSIVLEKHEEMLQFFFSAWLTNYESVQFDKKSISNMVNSKQDFLTFSSLVSILLYSVSFRDFKGAVENMSQKNIIDTLFKYLQNEDNKEQLLEQIKQLFIDLDNNILKNPYSIFCKEQQLEQINQMIIQYQINQNYEQFEISLLTYRNQWESHNNDVVLLLRQINLMVVGDGIYNQYFESFSKLIELIEANGQVKEINALQYPLINSELNKFADNAVLSFLVSYHIQFLKANFISTSSSKDLTIENMDIHLRTAIVQSVIQLFFFLNNSFTMATYKDLIKQIITPFKKFDIKQEDLLIKFADFDVKKKTFSLKKQYLPHGSNLTIWNSVSHLVDHFNKYIKNFNSEVTGTVQDILFVQEDFSFNKIVTIDNLTYQFNYIPQFSIVNFTKFISSDLIIRSLKTLLIGVKNIPKNISFLTLLQYIVYFIKESKQSPQLFAEIESDYKPSIFHHLYELYIKSNLLHTFLINILQAKDTQNVQEGTKLLLKMINTIVQQEEGITQSENVEEQQPQTAEEQEKLKEEQRKKKIEEMKKKQQEMLQKFAQQRNTFQQKQDESTKDENSEVAPVTTLKKHQSIVKNQDDEVEFCSICSEQIEKNSEFGYPIYIKQANNLTFLQKQYQQAETQQKEENKDKKFDDFYISVNSCGHFYHHKCWQDYQSKNSKRSEQNAHKFRDESEIPCSLCKRLANNFIQYIPENMRSRYSKKSIKSENNVVYSSEKLKQTLKEITTSLKQFEDDSKKMEDAMKFFDNIETVTEETVGDINAAEKEEKKDQTDQTENPNEDSQGQLSASTSQLNPLSMSKTISKSILFTQNDFITNVHDYLTCLNLSNPEADPIKIENLRETAFEKIFLKPFHHIEFSEIQEFISTHYKVYNNLLEYMRMNYINQFKSSKNSLTQLESFTQIQKESNLSDLFLREILTYFCLSYNLDPLHDINLFCQYFVLILAQSVKEKKNLSNLSSITNLTDILKDELLLQNHMEKLKQLLEYFLSYLCFRNIFPVKDLSKYDFCLLSQYLEVFNSAYSKYLSKHSTTFLAVLTQFAEKNLSTLQADFDFYNAKLKKEQSNKDKSILALRLPTNFEVYKREFAQKKCQKCDRLPFVNESKQAYKEQFGVSICLICEYTVCKTKCKVDMDKNQEHKIGNLTKHAIDVHGGSCMFIDAAITNVTYIHYPKAIVYESIYSTKYGELVELSSMNWYDYNLDSQANETIRKAVIFNSIPETLFRYINGYEKTFLIFKDRFL